MNEKFIWKASESEFSISKANLTGITCLKNFSYNKRYTGSKTMIVNQNGELSEKRKKKNPKKSKNPNATKKTYSIKKSRVTEIIHTWINQQKLKPKLYFITISYPNKIELNLAYSSLNNWLTQMKSTYSKLKYLWIAELQKNGTIHFHILVDQFVSIVYANNLMKKFLHKAIRDKKLEWSHVAASIYNGVDLAKNRKNKKVVNFALPNKKKAISKYLTKYITKSDAVFTRQRWQCSKVLVTFMTSICYTASEVELMLCEYIDFCNPSYFNEFFVYYPWLSQPPPELPKLLFDINESILNFVPPPIVEVEPKILVSSDKKLSNKQYRQMGLIFVENNLS